ncbi:hypothetical protein J1N35_045320 [Gossypium stocksii]|uniref:Uncharacterized protein n=1 Tax=Gossypium stocksii TaxID=47602 RepID=A0A9D3UAS2_9ROSI|nr:hypothetical protein J1N35_045320 [Gossypium stocksii]
MVALYSQTKRVNTEPIQLFAKLADVEPIKDIHSVVIEIDADGENRFDTNGHFDHECEDFSDFDLDEIPDDIDDEGSNDDENVYVPSIENSSHSIVIRNDLGVHMLNVDFDATHASKCFDIILAHRLAIDPKSKELFLGQQFANKDDCIFALK